MLFMLAGGLSGFAEEPAYPLLPADTSSPRATLNSFMENCTIAYGLLMEVGRTSSDEEALLTARKAVRNIYRCMDLREIADFRRDDTANEAAVALKEVLDRIEVPKERAIPDREDMLNEDGSLSKTWTLPYTEITFMLIEEGPMAGTYQFSADTVARATEFYTRIKRLPYKEGATEGFAETFLTSPGSRWLASIVSRLPSVMHGRKNGLALWQWIGLSVVLIAAMLVMITIYYVGRRMAGIRGQRRLLRYIVSLVFPILAIFVPLKALDIIENQLAVSGMVLYVAKFNLSLIALFATIVVVQGIGRRVGETIVATPYINENSIDAQLIRIMSRLLAVVASIVLLLQGGQHLGIPLSSLIAGAGVAGAALALSAQDVLKNVFGSIMLIMDKPFVVGERIKMHNYDGVVEEIGLRSTKLRLLNGHQAVIPNEDMARSHIENIGRRPHIRRITDIPLPVDIASTLANRTVEIVKEILDNHEGMQPDFPPRVWLDDIKRDHLNLRMIYWYHPPNYWDYTAHADAINRRILDAFENEGVRIAVPALTIKEETGGESSTDQAQTA
jgi:MscS family membrane protein